MNWNTVPINKTIVSIFVIKYYISIPYIILSNIRGVFFFTENNETKESTLNDRPCYVFFNFQELQTIAQLEIQYEQ